MQQRSSGEEEASIIVAKRISLEVCK